MNDDKSSLPQLYGTKAGLLGVGGEAQLMLRTDFSKLVHP